MNGGIRLNIGGVERRDGWSILNIVPGPHVDYLGTCSDLSVLDDGSCAEVYASHVIEHLKYTGEIQKTLAEIHRVLAPGGRLRLSVPDLDILCKLFLSPGLKAKHKFEVMKIMFGGQLDDHDCHYCGMNFEILENFLRIAGFTDIRRAGEFEDFADTNRMRFGGHLVSVNVEAVKPA